MLGHEASQVFGGSRTRWDNRLEQRIELDVLVNNQTHYSYVLAVSDSADGRRLMVKQEQLSTDGNVIYELAEGDVQLFGDKPGGQSHTRFPFVSTRSYLPLLEDREDNQLIMSFRRWLTGIWLFSLRPQALVPFSDSEDIALNIEGTNFVSWYRVLAQEHPQVRQSLLDDLSPVIPGLSEVRLIGTGASRRVMNLECKHTSTAKPYFLSLAELSDGQRALLVLYAITHIIASRASLLMFDEPDNFLAAGEIQPWLAGVREATMSGPGTLLVISHHPEVIDYLAPDQVLRLWREDGPTRVEEPEFDRSTGLSASDILRMEP